MINKKKLLFFISEDRYFCSHRLGLGIAALKAGFEVAIATRCDKHAQKIRDAGIQVFPLKYFTRTGINPIRQVQLLFELRKIYKTYNPNIVHHVAIKPVILGSLVARLCKIPRIINAFGGLGYLFIEQREAPKNGFLTNTKKTILHFLVCKIMKYICSGKNSSIIVQNSDDLETLSTEVRINPRQVSIIRGAGVDINAFPVTAFPPEPPVVITCISRLLWDKGIAELLAATKILRANNISVKVVFYGSPDPENPASLTEEQLQNLKKSGEIVWQGHCDNVAKAYADCHIAVLPSYREGLPKSLLEAASCGRPIVTTDVPGCREVVENGENGLLVPAKDSTSLANALITLIQNKIKREMMGQAGRARIEGYFTDTLIHEQTLRLYTNTLS